MGSQMGIWGARPLCSLQRRTHPDSGACLHAQLSSTELPLAERADVQVRSGIGRRWTQATPAVAWWGRAWGGLRARPSADVSVGRPPHSPRRALQLSSLEATRCRAQGFQHLQVPGADRAESCLPHPTPPRKLERGLIWKWGLCTCDRLEWVVLASGRP